VAGKLPELNRPLNQDHFYQVRFVFLQVDKGEPVQIDLKRPQMYFEKSKELET
jgi:hypothetical protein